MVGIDVACRGYKIHPQTSCNLNDSFLSRNCGRNHRNVFRFSYLEIRILRYLQDFFAAKQSNSQATYFGGHLRIVDSCRISNLALSLFRD